MRDAAKLYGRPRYHPATTTKADWIAYPERLEAALDAQTTSEPCVPETQNQSQDSPAARGYTQADREKDTISPAKQAASAAEYGTPADGLAASSSGGELRPVGGHQGGFAGPMRDGVAFTCDLVDARS